MKMTIAEPIQTLEYLRNSSVFPFSTKEGVLYTVESIDVVIEIMHKYEKIKEVLDDVWNRTNAMEVLLSIEEVLDGNVNSN